MLASRSRLAILAVVGTVAVLFSVDRSRAPVVVRPVDVGLPEPVADLFGVPSIAMLPDGGRLTLDLQTPIPIDASTARLDAALSLTPSTTPSQALIFTLDVSRSTLSAGGCSGDFNNDALSDTVLDCELAATLSTIERARDWGVAEVGIVVFDTIGGTADVGPQSSRQKYTAPDADIDTDGTLDLETVLRSAGEFPGSFGIPVMGVQRFGKITVSSVLGGGTNFKLGLRETCEILGFSSQPSRTVLFLSDGVGNFGGDALVELPCDASGTIHTVAVGAGSSCTEDPRGFGSLDEIAALGGGTCTHATDPGDLSGVLEGLVLPSLERVTLSVNGGAEVDVSDSVSAGLPALGSSTLEFSREIVGLGSNDELCLTVYASDPGTGAEISLTECLTVATNRAPVADAGADQFVTEGELTAFDGSGSSDPDGDALTYLWEIETLSGPPLLIPSARLPSTALKTLDDGDYLLTLTVSDGQQSASDTISLSVLNDVPNAAAELDGAMVGGIALLTASFTEEGVLDTHSARVDWGDGSEQAVSVGAQGTGWGSLFASHVYSAAGSYVVAITVEDDDGAEATVTTSLEITSTVGIYATATTGNAFDWSGGSGSIDGLVHSNAGVRVKGASKSLIGGLEYVTTADVASSAMVSPAATASDVASAPFAWSLADYAPGGDAAVQAGADYHDMSSSCTGGGWKVSTALGPGLYYVTCDVHLLGSQAEVTIVSEGDIKVSKQGSNLRPFTDGLLFLAGGGIQISAAGGTYLGHLVAGESLKATGAGNRFLCGIVADTVDLSGSSLLIEASDCVRPDRTTAPPILVPSLNVTLQNTPETTNPSQPVTSAVTLENDSTLLLVPGVVGLENHGTSTVTITNGTVTLEVLEVGATAWTALPGEVELVTQANGATGVSYVGDELGGATLLPGSLASWGAQLKVELPPDTTAWLLDPAQVHSVRTHVEFTVDDTSAPVRTLYRFGDDIAPALREMGSVLTAIQVTLTTVDGVSQLLDEGDGLPANLDAGEVATISAEGDAPTMAAIGAYEDTETYLNRLLASDGSSLGAFVSARAEGGVGHVLGPAALASTTLEVPVLEAEFSFPSEAVAGADLEVVAHVFNVSTAQAHEATAELSFEGTMDLTSFSTPLASGGISNGTLTISVDAAFAGLHRNLNGSWAWQDTFGNDYGPTVLTNGLFIDLPPALQATLVDELTEDVDGDGAPGAGDTIRYSGTVRNTGTVEILNVVVDLPLDARTTLVAGSSTSSRGSTSELGGTLVVALGSLGGLETASFSVETLIEDPIAAATGALFSQGTVSADSTDDVLTDDPAVSGEANPTMTSLVTDAPVLLAALDDELVVDADLDGGPSAGDTLRYVASVQVLSDTMAHGIAFEFTPDGYSHLDAGSVETDTGDIITGNDAEDSVVRIVFGDMEGLTVANVAFEVTVAGGPAVTLSAQGTIGGEDIETLLTDDPETPDMDDPTLTELGGSINAPGSPEVVLSSPVNGGRVAAPTELVASASAEAGTGVSSWSVSLYPAGGDSDAARILASGTGELPASLGTFDPTLLENGAWTLLVEVTDTLGRIGTAEASAVVDGGMKLGAYDLGFVDASWHSSLTAVTLLRGYSTLRRGIVGDFGYGWRLSLIDFMIQRNGALGEGGWSQTTCGDGFIFVPVCTTSDRPHLVTVRWPDGHVEAWDLALEEGSSFFPMLTTVSFDRRPGTTSTLEPADSDVVAYYDGHLYTDLTLGALYDPQQYWLTARDGTMYLLDLSDGLVQMVDRNGNLTEFDENGITPDRGVGVEFVRDGSDRITDILLADGSSLTYTYDDNGDLVSVTDQEGGVTEFFYEDHLLVEYGHGGRDPVAVMTYDADGRLVEQMDALGVLVETFVDLGGYLQTTVGPDPDLTEVEEYDADGLLVRMTRSFGGTALVTSWSYDEDFRPIGVVLPGGGERSLEYDDAGRILSELDPDGVLVEWSYDSDGDVLSMFVDGEIKFESTYDEAGNELSRRSADGTILVETSYDTWGGPLSWTDADGGVTEARYDAASQLNGLSVNGRELNFTLDATGRAQSANDPEGPLGTATFDGRGELVEYTDPSGHVERWTYDDRGYLVSTTDKAARENTFTYSDDGRLLTETTREGELVLYSYDEVGRLSRVEGPDVWVAYDYDALGQLVRAENAEVVLSFSYDADGNVLSEIVEPVVEDAYPDTTTTYSWSDAGRLLSATHAESARTLSYDTQGRVEALQDVYAGATTFGWDADDRVVSMERSTGLATRFGYTTSGRLVGLTTSVDGEEVDELVLSRDEDGRIIVRTDVYGDTELSYDDRGQLVSADHPPASGLLDESYSFDPNGNRSEASYDADRLEADDVYAYTYDREGRLTTRADVETLELTSYHWNAFDELVRIEHPDGSETTFTYDPLGRRLQIEHQGEVTRFSYEGDVLRATWDDENRLQTWLSTDPGGGLLAVWDAVTGQVRDALLDQLGSRRGWVTDGVVELDPRDSFGNPLAVSGDVEPHALSWHDQDPTGLVYARARYLDPETGRFLSEDPVDSRNRYTYASNDPVGQWDPYGLAAAIEYGGLNKKEAGTVEPKRRVAARIACTLFQNASAIGLLSVSMPVEIVLEGACDAAAGGPGKCFVAGTEVLTPGGGVPIEEIKPGDVVLARGPGGTRFATVVETYVRMADEIIEARIAPLLGPDFTLHATPEHPFYVPAHRGYVDLRDLEPGTRLRLADGSEAALLGTRSLYGQKEVFNLSVAEAHSYFVGEDGGNGAGVLVHNGRYEPKFKSKRVIAKGYDIGKIDELVRQCGGDPRFWLKMAGTLANGDEMHWYEHPDVRGRIGQKYDGDVDPRVLCK